MARITSFLGLTVWAVTVAALAIPAGAATGGGLYDMRAVLAQPYPLSIAKPPAPMPTMMPAAPASAMPAAMKPALPLPAAPPPKLTPPPPPPKRTALPPPAVAEARPDDGGVISEIRLGALVHDEGPFSHRKESGYDGNFEVLFVSPDVLDVIWAPRPHLGLSVNSSNDTNQVYAGLTWELGFLDAAFFDFSLGGAVHDGATETDELDKKSLGCHVLFRESLDLGYRFAGAHALSLHFAHISNAKLCSTNEGLESFGLRYGYMF